MYTTSAPSHTKQRLRQHRQAGQTLVEVLVAIAITSIMLPALATALVASRESKPHEIQRAQATALLREADEAVRAARAANWSSIATPGTYHPIVSGNSWSLVSGSETIDTNFTRQVVVTDVARDSTGAITTGSGTNDPSTKKIVTTISWNSPIASSVSSTTYAQRYRNNLAWLQTTQADFNAGTLTNTATTNTSGGEVQLAASGSGGSGTTDWSTPSIVGSYDTPSTNNPSAIYVDSVTKRTYITVNTTLYIIDTSTPASPTLLGSINISGIIYDIQVSGNYAYLATSDDSKELTIINVSTPASPSITGSANIGGSVNALSVAVAGTYAYVGTQKTGGSLPNEFYSVNVTNPAAPTVASGIDINDTVNSITISNNYAYLAGATNTAEVTIVAIASPTAPTIASRYDTLGTADAVTVTANGSTLYVGVNANGSSPEFFILNITTPTSPTLVGSYNTSQAVTGIAVNGTNAFLSTAVSGQTFTALDISTPSSPTLTGVLDLGASANRIAYAAPYAYVASQNDNQELAIVGGTTSGGSNFVTSGTYTSRSFDAGSSVGFNYLTFVTTKPANTNVQLQVATNTDNTTWNYVGPDGTSSSYYTGAGAIPLSRVSGRYFRYTAQLTGPGTSTPILQESSVNYSP